MVDQRYQVTWRLYDVSCDVSLILDSELLAKAQRGNGVKETPAKIEICQLVRNTATITQPQLRMQAIHFDHLTFRSLS